VLVATTSRTRSSWVLLVAMAERTSQYDGVTLMTKVLNLFMYMDAQSSSLSEREFTVFQCVWREMKGQRALGGGRGEGHRRAVPQDRHRGRGGMTHPREQLLVVLLPPVLHRPVVVCASGVGRCGFVVCRWWRVCVGVVWGTPSCVSTGTLPFVGIPVYNLCLLPVLRTLPSTPAAPHGECVPVFFIHWVWGVWVFETI
jgi:hypothetical protein